MMRLFLPLTVLALFTSTAFAAPKKVAVVKLLRGSVSALTLGKTTPLKMEDWVEDGSVVKTEDKSFVKLVFLDKSQMNIGPNSEMKIEKFNGKDSGVIDLVKGKIRSQVTKDYLQIQDKDKSKLFIKTKNAVMGVRGTDFMISTNGTNTSTVLFEGEVVFNNISNPATTNTAALEEVVSAGVRMVPGEFSVVEAQQPPTVPSLLNVQQLEKLEKNPNFTSDNRAPAAGTEVTKSVVPPGLTGAVVSNNSQTIKSEVSTVVSVAVPVVAATAGPAAGFVDGNTVKPTNGSFVDIESGVIIPPAPGSVLDTNTNTYIPAPGSGTVATDGNYVPPSGVVITPAGQVLVTVVDTSGQQIQKEVPKPSPAGSVGPVVNTSVTPAPVAAGDTARGPASSPAPVAVNTFTAAANNPALNLANAQPAAGPGSVFSGGQVGNTQIAPPSASANPQSEPAVTSGAAATNGNYTINVNHQ